MHAAPFTVRWKDHLQQAREVQAAPKTVREEKRPTRAMLSRSKGLHGVVE